MKHLPESNFVLTFERLSVHPSALSVHLSVYLSCHLSICLLYVHPSVRP